MIARTASSLASLRVAASSPANVERYLTRYAKDSLDELQKAQEMLPQSRVQPTKDVPTHVEAKISYYDKMAEFLPFGILQNIGRSEIEFSFFTVSNIPLLNEGIQALQRWHNYLSHLPKDRQL